MRKTFLWVLASLLVLGLLLVLLGPALIHTEKSSAFLAREISQVTGAEVELGTVRVNFWPRVNLAVGPGSLMAAGQDAMVRDFSWRSLKLVLSWGALLRGHLDVEAVVLEGLACSGEVDRHIFSLTGGRLHCKGFTMSLSEGRAPDSLFLGEAIPLWLEIQQGEYDGLVFANVHAQGHVLPSVLDLTQITARIGSGHIAGYCKMTATMPDQVAVDFSAKVKSVPAASLLAAGAPDIGQRWEGVLDGHAKGNFLINNQVLVPASLALEGQFSGQDGVIHAGDWLEDIKGYLGNRQDLTDIQYQHFVQDFAVEKGRAQLEFSLGGLATDWSGSGWVGLDGTLAVALQVVLPPGFTPSLGGWSGLAASLQDQDGRMTLAMNLTGRTAHPTLALDLAKTLGGSGEGAGKVLGKGLGGLLDKWKVR